jgi:hypothetical protein
MEYFRPPRPTTSDKEVQKRKELEMWSEVEIWREWIKPNCVMCEREIPMTEQRYYDNGNSCTSCNSIANRNAYRKIKLEYTMERRDEDYE